MSAQSGIQGHVLALSGGVGGAKLASGLAAVLPEDDLTIVVNTGDDFEHFGLTICPDIDSVVYALADLNDTDRGWGVRGESWQAMEMLRRLGAPAWFNLGDRDLGMHLARSRLLSEGATLSAATHRLARELGIRHAVVPMSDGPVRTQVQTDAGWLDFQDYFVREQCVPAARAIRFAGAAQATPSPRFAGALNRDDLACVVFCPSNPLLSVDPVLAMGGVRDSLRQRGVPIVAVSPLIGGKALKGPLAKLLTELDKPLNHAAILDHYGGLIDHLIIDETDAAQASALRDRGVGVSVTRTLMRDAADRARLARDVLAAACGADPSLIGT